LPKIPAPHFSNFSSNPLTVIENLQGVLTAGELQKIRNEVRKNCKGLFDLGSSHFAFACTIPVGEWRQRISRLYYAAYNVRRAVGLEFDGSFSQDSSDHKKIEAVPDDFPDVASYNIQFKNLRDDRNLADYSHLAVEGNLVQTADAYQQLVTQFIEHARAYLVGRGVPL
jgi:hypothetical protein